jgi:tetrahydrodipicolinate N-succinyltransferase
MKEQLEQRLIELRKEYEAGQKIMEDIELKIVELENRQNSLSETLLRISGAINLLEEVLEKSEGVHEQLIKAVLTSEGAIEVPNVVRQSLEKAKKSLKEAGLATGEVVEQKGILPIGVMAGEIIRQEPKQGTKLPAGSAVNLVVAAKGKYLPTIDKKSVCNSYSGCNCEQNRK